MALLKHIAKNHETKAKRSGLSVSDLPQPGECGGFVRDKVLGGQEAEITDFPWMALIEHTKRKQFEFY